MKIVNIPKPDANFYLHIFDFYETSTLYLSEISTPVWRRVREPFFVPISGQYKEDSNPIL